MQGRLRPNPARTPLLECLPSHPPPSPGDIPGVLMLGRQVPPDGLAQRKSPPVLHEARLSSRAGTGFYSSLVPHARR